MKTKNKKDIKYGDVDLLQADEFDPKYGKERITLFLDQQVVDAFREQAQQKGAKYQTLIREALRECIFGNSKKDIEHRLDRIEAALFKKRA